MYSLHNDACLFSRRLLHCTFQLTGKQYKQYDANLPVILIHEESFGYRMSNCSASKPPAFYLKVFNSTEHACQGKHLDYPRRCRIAHCPLALQQSRTERGLGPLLTRPLAALPPPPQHSAPTTHTRTPETARGLSLAVTLRLP